MFSALNPLKLHKYSFDSSIFKDKNFQGRNLFLSPTSPLAFQIDFQLSPIDSRYRQRVLAG